LRIADKSIHEFLNDIATKPCTPAGGCVAALCAASSSALMEMVARHTLNHKDKSEEVANYMEEVVEVASEARKRFLDYMDIDTKAYKDVINAQKQDLKNIDEYHKASVNVPLEMAQRLSDIIDIIRKTTRAGSEMLVTDGVAALLMAKITLNSLIYHIQFNLMYIQDQDFVDKVTTELGWIEEKLRYI